MTEDQESPAPRPTSEGRSGVLRAILVVAVLCGVAFGYWRFVYYPTTPQYALREFLDAVRAEDYALCYRRLHVPAPIRLLIPTAEALERLARSAGGLIPRLEDYRLGRVTEKGDTATVMAVLITRQEAATTAHAEELEVHMVRQDDRWQVDGGWVLEELIRRGGAELRRSLFPPGSEAP